MVELNGIEPARPAVSDREDALRWVGLFPTDLKAGKNPRTPQSTVLPVQLHEEHLMVRICVLSEFQ
jgi:hypothetical protein